MKLRIAMANHLHIVLSTCVPDIVRSKDSSANVRVIADFGLLLRQQRAQHAACTVQGTTVGCLELLGGLITSCYFIGIQ